LHDCIESADDYWTSTERWAWVQICARQPIDLDWLPGNTKKHSPDTCSADPRRYRDDPRRYLNGLFIEKIFTDPRYADRTQNAPISIRNAYVDQFSVRDATIKSFAIVDSYVNSFALENVTVTTSVRIAGSSFGTISLTNIQGGAIELDCVTTENFVAQKVYGQRLWISNSTTRLMDIGVSRLSDTLVILGGSHNEIAIGETSSNGLYVQPTSLRSLNIGSYRDSAMFYLKVDKWLAESNLTLKTVSVGKFTWWFGEIPAKASIQDFSFTDADWGDDPLLRLKQLQAITPQYSPSMYSSLAKAYLDSGQSDIARRILIAKQNEEFERAGWGWEAFYLFVTWLIADYGYHPEIGFLWIIGFVLLGGIIFVTGSNKIVGDARPDNWFVFALDAVIPGIQLDKVHSDVRFSDWRQYCLYFLRFLGAVVVVLAIEFVKRSILGPS
jgi:hypothetical protein